MKHIMKLQYSPFNSIKNKTKTIEMRLYDEKRQLINIKDTIIFNKIDTNESLETEVINIYRFKDFNELYNHFDKLSIGYKENEKANPLDMNKYYSNDDIKKYGVVGIEIKVK